MNKGAINAIIVGTKVLLTLRVSHEQSFVHVNQRGFLLFLGSDVAFEQRK